MTEKEILELEKDNYTTIHLHLVGIFWRAYQRSALGFCKEIRPYKMNVRSNKRQRTVVSFLGFPDSALQELLEVEGCTRVDDSHITLPMEYLSDEEVTELLPAYNDLPEKVQTVITPVFLCMQDVLRHKYAGKKFSFEELYNDICMESYLKRNGGI